MCGPSCREPEFNQGGLAAASKPIPGRCSCRLKFLNHFDKLDNLTQNIPCEKHLSLSILEWIMLCFSQSSDLSSIHEGVVKWFEKLQTAEYSENDKASNLMKFPKCPGLFAFLGHLESSLRSRVHRWMHWSEVNMHERGTVDTAKANWSPAIITGEWQVGLWARHWQMVELYCCVLLQLSKGTHDRQRVIWGDCDVMYEFPFTKCINELCPNLHLTNIYLALTMGQTLYETLEI